MAAALVAAATRGAGAPAQAASEIAVRGTARMPSCASCHGPAGEGVAATSTPRLAGLPRAYLREQLDAFTYGQRGSAAMAPLSRALSAAQRAQLADYYGALPAHLHPAGSATATEESLALRGRWSQEIPPCVQCHGGRGTGVGALPALAGQPAAYLAAQLHAWQDGSRRGDPLRLMQKIASRLSDADIRAVSEYFAAQPALSGLEPASTPSPRAPEGIARAARAPGVFQPADSEPVPADEFGKVVSLGLAIFENTQKYAAPYVGNDLRCSSCHLDAGRRVGSAPMWAAYVSYPAWRAKNGHVNTYAERLQGCFQYSMNGRAPPLGDPVLVALESYSYWMARGAPVNPNIAGRGYPKPGQPASPPDAARGARVYARSCALCHGEDGGGQRDNEGAPAFPALWGGNSYNWGAGMVNVANAAAFIKGNMPLSQGNTLSDQDAWDVAQFVDSHERPQDPRYTGSVSATRSRYHEHDDSMYGKVVDGYLLGSEAVPPGQIPSSPRAAPAAR